MPCPCPASSTKSSRRSRLSVDALGAFDTWAVIAASAVVLAIVIGTLPRVPW
jgi:hypothetical protein